MQREREKVNIETVKKAISEIENSNANE